MDSVYGRGSTFTIKFPAKTSPEKELFSGSIENLTGFSFLQGKSTFHFTGRKYLILDDVEENTFMVAHILSKNGALPIPCNKAELAIEVFRDTADLDGVITDLRMPEISGQEFIMAVRKIEREENRRPVPIVVLTAESDPEERMLCLGKYGANKFLLKPIKLYDLMVSLCKIDAEGEKKKLRVMIVDDEATSTCCLERLLTNEERRVTICGSIAEVSRYSYVIIGERSTQEL